MTFAENNSHAIQGGFRTRVGAGVVPCVKEAYDKAITTFPEVLADGGTGARFSDLEQFFMASDSRRNELLAADAKDLGKWQTKKHQLELQVQANDKAISESSKKVAEWKQLITAEEGKMDVHQDVSLSE